MIETLSISNYALIDTLDLSFTPGLNIITGETGSGKSIILGALSMLFGNRADMKVVADKNRKSVVEATFGIKGYESLRKLFDDNDIDWNDDELILRREINTAGRTRSFVNDQPAPLSLLREIAIHLVDIHSQHQNLLLSMPEYQLRIIDTLLPDQTVKDNYRKAYVAFRAALKKYQVAKRALETGKTEEEYFRFQLEKLNELNLVSGEQEQLEQQRDLLSNMTELKISLARMQTLFNEGEENIVGMLREAESLVASTGSVDKLQGIDERIESLRIEALDIAETIADAYSRLEDNPRLLEQTEERLNDIYDLQRKFGVESVEQLIALRDEISSKLEVIDNGDERLRELAQGAKSAKKHAVEAAAQLTQARQRVAEAFSCKLRDNAVPLGMKNLVVDIRLNPADLSPEGADNVEFLFAFNKNQPLMPVKDTASGGEISRLMLSIKAIIADRIQLPSIIFDEVDTGVSGDIANRMGEMMKDISRRIQVISITHLPPVAAKGDTHFKVFKEDSETATNTRVRRLGEEERIGELAMMLSGDSNNEAARQTAISLLEKQKKQ